MKVKETATRAAGGRPSLQRAAEISAALTAATIDAFAARGADFNIDEIAKKTGISKQAIYRRWTSKVEMLRFAIDQEVRRVAKSYKTDLPEDPLEALRTIALWMFEQDKGWYHRLNTFIQAEALRDPEWARSNVQWRELVLGMMEAQLRLIVPAKEVRILAEILLTQLSGTISVLAASETTSGDYQAIFETHWTMYLRLLNASSAGAIDKLQDRPAS